MNKWMYDCILEAPGTCKDIIEKKDVLLKGLIDLYLSKEFEEIVFVASGSSYNIANCAKYAIQKFLKVRVTVINSITFAKYENLYFNKALILCLFQSGRSTNTIAAVKKAKEMGYTCGAISMVVDSPISRYCDHVFNYGSHECGQDVFVCRGVPTSSLFLMLFALEAGLKKQVITLEDYDAHINQLNKVTELMIEVRQKADKWYENNKKEFYSMKRAMVCGIGPSFGVANEGALKMEETIGIPSNVYELEEFLHGPTYEIKKDNAVFLVDMDEASHDRIMTIYKAMFELTDRVYLITNSDEVSGDNVLNIHSDIAEELRTLLFVIPFQVLASRVCDDLRIRAITIFNYRSAQLLKTKTD